ncbi:hypothetical protein P7C70_g1625, partial [Phenoliferia sp. Uapishka_3]
MQRPSTPANDQSSSASRQLELKAASLARTALLRGKKTSAEDWAAIGRRLKLGKGLGEVELHPYQTQVGDAHEAGLDTGVVAGCGLGKTMLFVMAVLAHLHRGTREVTAVIVVPLSVLGTDHAVSLMKICADFNLKAVALSSLINLTAAYASITAREVHIVICSAERLSTESFRKAVLPIVDQIVLLAEDEAQVSKEWEKFRPTFNNLHLFRTELLPHTPALITSATLPPSYYRQASLAIDLRKDHLFIDLGNDRGEINFGITSMLHHSTRFRDLEFLINQKGKVMVYCDNKNKLLAMYWHFADQRYAVGDNDSDLGFYTADMSSGHKRIEWALWKQGKLRLLFTTLALAMGAHAGGVTMVVQWTCSGLTPSQLVQRAGRAVREEGDGVRTFLCFVEAKMRTNGESGRRAALLAGGEDTGMVDLANLQANQCIWTWLNLYFRHPPPPSASTAVTPGSFATQTPARPGRPPLSSSPATPSHMRPPPPSKSFASSTPSQSLTSPQHNLPSLTPEEQRRTLVNFPPRPVDLCCSGCHPSILDVLLAIRFDISSASLGMSGLSRTTAFKSELLSRLELWRAQEWRTKWIIRQPHLGPKAWLSDACLSKIVERSGTISSEGDLKDVVRIARWKTVGPELFKSFRGWVEELDEQGMAAPRLTYEAMDAAREASLLQAAAQKRAATTEAGGSQAPKPKSKRRKLPSVPPAVALPSDEAIFDLFS